MSKITCNVCKKQGDAVESTDLVCLLCYDNLKLDMEFLLDRAMKAGSCSFMGNRDTGVSSNNIVAIAYGVENLINQRLPSDQADLQACRNMWKKLPRHRETTEAKEAMTRAEKAISEKFV